MDSQCPPDFSKHPDSRARSTRREFLGHLGGALATGMALNAGIATATPSTPPSPSPAPPTGPFSLAPLAYAPGALEPVIDARTMEIHHGRHHKAYVDNLNRALSTKAEMTGKSLREILGQLGSVPEDIRTTVRNNGGGHHNHTLFWEIMTPGGAREPGGDLLSAINMDLGSFDNLKLKFNAAGLGLFGSGWVFLVKTKAGKLAIQALPNQDSPLMTGDEPLLGNDVWEHAYYLQYQNRRRDYLEAWWKVVNWGKVSDIFNGKVQKL
jgi:Fe-Mn family superoxide dismutase